MTDLFFAPQVTATVPHVVKHVAHVVPHITTGVSTMMTMIYAASSMAAGFGLGWYIKGRGMAGVQIDLNNIKTDIVDIKAKLSAPTPAPAA